MRALDIEGLSFRQLRLFEAVGRVNSVHRAAEECNLSQPAVTQALAKLEQIVGGKLLDRRSSGSYLNDSGEILYRRAVRFFMLLEQAIQELDSSLDERAARIVANRFSLSQVGCLVSIVDTGSFAHAADKLGIKSDSLQRIVRTIEKNLGEDIICSNSNGKSLTAGGLHFGRRMKLALQEICWGLDEIDEAMENSTTQIVIGALPFGGSVLLASVLENFVSIHPEADVKIVNEEASELLRSLDSGAVDFVIGLEQETAWSDFKFEALGKTPYTVAARRHHPLMKKDKVTIEDLTEYHWVIGTPGSHRRACFDRLFEGAQSPRASLATSALPIIRHLLESSDRLTLMTSFELYHDRYALAPVPFEGIDIVPSLGITTRSNWLPKKVHSDFIALLRDRISAMSAPSVRDAFRAVAAV